MNKLLVVIASMAFSTSLLANDLRVSVQNNTEANSFNIHFATVRTNSSMCRMEVTKLNLNKPTTSFRNVTQNGKIEISAEVSYMSRCMHAFGPHSGNINLTQGYGLPALTEGSYELAINGQNYGMLVLANDGVTLVNEVVENEISVTGKIMTGIMAIGGETTGTIIITEQGTFELDVNDRNEINFEAFNGKNVQVKGVLENRAGVEIANRKIITVTSIKAVR